MYRQEITRKHRTAIVIAVDQSLSMCGEVCAFGSVRSKADMVAYAVNSVLSELVARATRDDEVRNYYDIAVVGYSDSRAEAVECGGTGVRFLLDDSRRFVPVTELAARTPRLMPWVVHRRTVTGGVASWSEELPMWIEPCACGTTPMYEALLAIRDLVRDWCGNPANGESFPPVVINITDGEASDCDEQELLDITRRIRALRTADGNVLLMNIHIAENASPVSLLFPTDSEIDGSDRYASLLARCSSRMPRAFNPQICESRGVKNDAGASFVALGYNISPEGMFAMLNIGSRSVTGLR